MRRGFGLRLLGIQTAKQAVRKHAVAQFRQRRVRLIGRRVARQAQITKIAAKRQLRKALRAALR